MKEAIRKTMEVVGGWCSTLSIRMGSLFEMRKEELRILQDLSPSITPT